MLGGIREVIFRMMTFSITIICDHERNNTEHNNPHYKSTKHLMLMPRFNLLSVVMPNVVMLSVVAQKLLVNV
jgi:hypothetical protein